MELRENLTIGERFRLVRELGRGAMGAVWLAHHLGLDIPCAIKFIDSPLRGNADVRARLAREARAEAAIRSPHVVQIFDFGTWEDTPYIVMEYLEGESLAARLDRLGRLDPKTAQRVISQVAHALQKAHLAGIVHRDLKPENIFLIGDDDGETAKVFDFGVAQVSRGISSFDGMMGEGRLVGTPLYMSPEQARGSERVDHRSDLWSLAVVAFECLTGQPPFFSEDLRELLAKILHEPVLLPSQVAGDLPLEIDDWWLRAVARDPAARFQSAKDLAKSFANALRFYAGRRSEPLYAVANMSPSTDASMSPSTDANASPSTDANASTGANASTDANVSTSASPNVSTSASPSPSASTSASPDAGPNTTRRPGASPRRCPSVVATRLGHPSPSADQALVSRSQDGPALDSLDLTAEPFPSPVTSSTEPAASRRPSLVDRSRTWLAVPRHRRVAAGVTTAGGVLFAVLAIFHQSHEVGAMAGTIDKDPSRNDSPSQVVEVAPLSPTPPPNSASESHPTAPVVPAGTVDVTASATTFVPDPAVKDSGDLPPSGRANAPSREARVGAARSGPARAPLLPGRAPTPGTREKSNNPEPATASSSVHSRPPESSGTSTDAPHQPVDFGF